MADNKWKYVAGGAKAGEVDCSGAFTYWYKQAGSYMYHGSNTMWRNYATEKGKIGEIELVPGMAVYKRRNWTSNQQSNKWYKNEPGDLYHVGLYIGNGQVVEAKGTRYGVVYSAVEEWMYCSRLKYTQYDLSEDINDLEDEKIVYPFIGVVNTKSGVLNVREEPSTSSRILNELTKGTTIQISGKTGNWYCVSIDGEDGYVSAEYVAASYEAPEQERTVSFTVRNEAMLEEVIEYLTGMGITPHVTGD